MRRLLIVLVVLIALVAGGLAIGESVVRSQLSDQIALGVQRQLALPQRPTVTLQPNPVLLDLVQRKLTRVDLSTPTWPMEVTGHWINLREAAFSAEEITLDTRQATVGRLHGSVQLATADLATIAGLPITSQGGRLQVSQEVTVLGQRLEAKASGVPALDVAAQTVRIEDAQIEVVGIALDRGLSQQLADRLLKPIPIALEFGLRLSAIEVNDAGLRLTASARDFPVALG